ncbi:methyltransferase domain-containing protein [Geodermatophilus sp. SYSU D00697]
MPLTVLQGPPGSGKSTYLIQLVNSAISGQRRVATFASRDNPNPATVEYGLLGSRRPGLTCPVDHILGTREAMDTLARLPAGTLVVFDEAYRFGPEVAPGWLDASARGLDVVVATPSDAQLRQLSPEHFVEQVFSSPCQQCGRAEATTALVDVDHNTTLSLCRACEQDLTAAAEADIADRLVEQAPYPGERVVYQPVELPVCAGWRVLRPDSPDRFDLMARVVREAGLPVENASAPTYLDVGCNTGYFCHRMSELGFAAEGVDVVTEDIEVARLLDLYVRKGGVTYTVADAHAYLTDTVDTTIDVTSAYAVFQWVMAQTSVERSVECFELLFAKTGRLCFVEMGYASEDQYTGVLPAHIDRGWVFDVMSSRGDFSEIRMYDAGHHDLMFGSRDLFVGIK